MGVSGKLREDRMQNSKNKQRHTVFQDIVNHTLLHSIPTRGFLSARDKP